MTDKQLKQRREDTEKSQKENLRKKRKSNREKANKEKVSIDILEHRDKLINSFNGREKKK